MATTEDLRADLRRLVDQLPEGELHAARRFLEYLRCAGAPVLRAFTEAPLDDEPETEEERAAVEEARRDFAAGRVVTHEEVKRRVLGQA
ncbi:MAG: hypothetical protein HY691_03430 [Chloroflexi bacterium]|nr:hypothetical protein [Chloroflexota bacterium]